MILIQDVIKKRKLYQILALIVIGLDLIAFCTMEGLDLWFSLQDSNYPKMLMLTIIKIIVIVTFISFLFSMIILKFINTLIISAIAYLVIGVILFCCLLIDQIKEFHTAVASRPINYFKYNVDIILIVLNILTGFFRISGGILIILFITLLKVEKKRFEEENNEHIILNESITNINSFQYDNYSNS